jgi:hypothetical protein
MGQPDSRVKLLAPEEDVADMVVAVVVVREWGFFRSCCCEIMVDEAQRQGEAEIFHFSIKLTKEGSSTKCATPYTN